MIATIRIKALDCKCDICGHAWVSLAQLPPAACSICKSRSWNGEKTIGRPIGSRDIAHLMPKPKRVRATT